MSGIAGCVCLGTCETKPHRPLVEKMLDLLAHRGPGARRIVEGRRVCAGAVGQRACDPDGPPPPPVVTKDGRQWIAFDGVLFNRKLLQEELERLGRRLQSDSNAEVALQAYCHWGEASLERFVGMFAFAAHDEEKGTTLLARDHYGVKPLHYSARGGHLNFASEVKALLSAGPAPVPNKRAVLEWLLHGDVMAPETLFEGVFSLAPGHMLVVDTAGAEPRCRRYYDPCDHVDRALHEAYRRMPVGRFVDELDAALQRSLSECVEGEERVGVLLSGGLDSALVTALAAKTMKTVALHASVGDDPASDERSAAEDTARALGVPFSCVTVNEPDFIGELALCTHRNEMPIWHTQYVAFHLLAQRAREEGLRVILCGSSIGTMLGASGGRRSGQKWFRPAERVLRHLPWKVVRGIEKAVYAHRRGLVEAPDYTIKMIPMTHLVDGYARASLLRRCDEAHAFIRNEAERGVQATRVADLSLFLPRFFHRADRLAMAHSVEHRNPFQDTESIHMAINLPLPLLLRGRRDKWAMRKVAARHVPMRCVERAKVAWALPLERYLESLATPALFREGFSAEFFRLESRAVETIPERWRENPRAFFALMAIEVWGRIFILGESVERVTERLHSPASPPTTD